MPSSEHLFRSNDVADDVGSRAVAAGRLVVITGERRSTHYVGSGLTTLRAVVLIVGCRAAIMYRRDIHQRAR